MGYEVDPSSHPEGIPEGAVPENYLQFYREKYFKFSKLAFCRIILTKKLLCISTIYRLILGHCEGDNASQGPKRKGVSLRLKSSFNYSSSEVKIRV